MAKDFFHGRLDDCIALSRKSGKTKSMDFLDPAGQIRAAAYLRRHLPDGLSFVLDGGYADAERRALFIGSEPLQPDRFLTALRFTAAGPAGHRDYLGAILGAGVDRDKVGDILVAGTVARAVVKTEVASYIVGAVDRVGRFPVEVTPVSLDEIVPPPRDPHLITATVPSLRLDAVAARAFGLSRSQVVPLIKGEKIRVNWVPVTVPSREITPKDVLSLRGKGRAVLAEVKGTSRKGRLVITIERYF